MCLSLSSLGEIIISYQNCGYRTVGAIPRCETRRGRPLASRQLITVAILPPVTPFPPAAHRLADGQ